MRRGETLVVCVCHAAAAAAIGYATWSGEAWPFMFALTMVIIAGVLYLIFDSRSDW